VELLFCGKENKNMIVDGVQIKILRRLDFLKYFLKNNINFKKTLIHSHGIFPINLFYFYDVMHIHGEVKPRDFLRKKITQQLLKKAYVCCPYQKQKKKLIEEFDIGEKKIFIIENTIDTRLFKPKRGGKKTLFYSPED